MSEKPNLFQSTYYQIFVRNYSKEGNFDAVTNDLERIKDLGPNIIYLMPIFPIGKAERKGTWGSPYAIQDYFAISPDLGDFDSLHRLIKKAHDLGFKIILDMVFNHTSPDNVLTKTHPEFYFYKPDGKRGNRVGDWADVVDLAMDREDTQEYFVGILDFWLKQGFDGFRFDVASVIPLSFFKRAREKLGYGPLFLAESVHPEFVVYCRSVGKEATFDRDLYPTFDDSYCYNTFQDFIDFIKGKAPNLIKYKEGLKEQEKTFPKGFVKCMSFENHDFDRIAGISKNETVLRNVLAWSFCNKGSAFLYAGEEFKDTHKPELFEKDPIEHVVRNPAYLELVKKLVVLKAKPLFGHIEKYELLDCPDACVMIRFESLGDTYVGLFAFDGKKERFSLEEGAYDDLISGQEIVSKGEVETVGPLFLKKRK